MMSGQKLLFVDDEKAVLTVLERSFSHLGYAVHTASSGESALEVLCAEEIHVMFFDLNMPGMSGIELCRQVKAERPMALIFALTGYAGLFELSECREVGFDDYFQKPVDLKLLHTIVQDAMDKQRRWKTG